MLCADCREKIVRADGDIGTGYGICNGKKVCYACCALRDIADMRDKGRAVLYVTQSPQSVIPNWPVVRNWPGTLSFVAKRAHRSINNWGAQRLDVWFTDSDGQQWWGVNCGDNDIIRCRRLKAA
jgi:hypothetical protein